MAAEANDGCPATAVQVLVVEPPCVVTYTPSEVPPVPVPATMAYTTGVANPEEPLDETGKTETTPSDSVQLPSGLEVVTGRPVAGFQVSPESVEICSPASRVPK